MTHGERDGQADEEPVLDEFEGLVDEMRGSLGRGREWQHDDMHEQVNQCSVNESAKDGAAEQKCEVAAGQVLNRCRSEGDDEMQNDSQRGGPHTPAIRFQAKDAAGNGLRNKDGLARTVHGDGVGEIQYSDNQATYNDGRYRTRVCQG
jgi:hypothetical protein